MATTETTGGVTFPAVWKGVYSITVTKDGYLPFAEDNVVIDADATYPIELYEIIIAPYGLLVTQDGNDDILLGTIKLVSAMTLKATKIS